MAVLVANTLVLAQAVTGTKIPQVSALTNIECYQKFDGKATGSGTNGELTSQLQRQYNNSNCPSSKGGNCTMNGSSSGQAAINCTVAAQNQCKADFDGKAIPGELDLDEYEASGCSTANGGPCKINNTPSVSTVTCGTGAAGTDKPESEDDSGTGTSDIGNEYDTEDCTVDPGGLESSNCELIKMIVLITNVLSGLAATVIVAMIIVGGIQYSMAGAEAAKVQAAKQKITNALLALLLLVFGFSIIQWLVPGGLI